MTKFTEKGDVFLSPADVAVLLKVNEFEVVTAAKSGEEIHGVVLPQYVSYRGKFMRFRYTDIMETLRNK